MSILEKKMLTEKNIRKWFPFGKPGKDEYLHVMTPFAEVKFKNIDWDKTDPDVLYDFAYRFAEKRYEQQ